jgi:hypothetical protein
MFFYFLFCSVVKTYVNASAGKMARIYIEIIIMSTLLFISQLVTYRNDEISSIFVHDRVGEFYFSMFESVGWSRL